MDGEHPCGGGFGELVGDKLDVSWHCEIAAKCLLGHIQSSVGSRTREEKALERP